MGFFDFDTMGVIDNMLLEGRAVSHAMTRLELARYERAIAEEEARAAFIRAGQEDFEAWLADKEERDELLQATT
ncbi:MAG TPA: hypothetical protein VM537_09830 [Anaerolineae bacterium]|nr:hypothetical protein [Anaerolineae bacterium]